MAHPENPLATRGRLALAHDQLIGAIESLMSGADWQAMLEVAARFHRYSTNNIVLIALQCPHATRVGGYRFWQELGRHVRKGEQGLRILAPRGSRSLEADEDGTDSGRSEVRWYKTVTVFDISQTEGADLADCQPVVLEGDGVEGFYEQLRDQVQVAGYQLMVCSSTEESAVTLGRAYGATSHSERTVSIAHGLSSAQRAKTTAHELAHVLLHPDTASYTAERGRCEVEAESVAFLVCQAMGLATDSYSWPYIAHWSEGNVDTVKESVQTVVETSRSILARMDTASADSSER